MTCIKQTKVGIINVPLTITRLAEPEVKEASEAKRETAPSSILSVLPPWAVPLINFAIVFIAQIVYGIQMHPNDALPSALDLFYVVINAAGATFLTYGINVAITSRSQKT